MSGQPTKRGNWGTWAVIDYSGRRIPDEDELPRVSSKSRFKKSNATIIRSLNNSYTKLKKQPVISDDICVFVTPDSKFKCTNLTSGYYDMFCVNCSLLKKTSARVGNERFTSRTALLSNLGFIAPTNKMTKSKVCKQKTKKKYIVSSCIYRVDKKCSFSLSPCVNCDSCARFHGQNESNSKCKYNFGVEHDKCSLHHSMCDKAATESVSEIV